MGQAPQKPPSISSLITIQFLDKMTAIIQSEKEVGKPKPQTPRVNSLVTREDVCHNRAGQYWCCGSLRVFDPSP